MGGTGGRISWGDMQADRNSSANYLTVNHANMGFGTVPQFRLEIGAPLEKEVKKSTKRVHILGCCAEGAWRGFWVSGNLHMGRVNTRLKVVMK